MINKLNKFILLGGGGGNTHSRPYFKNKFFGAKARCTC